MISTLSITSMIRMPNCTYQVLQAVSTGPPARYAQIGDAVYHKWSCVGGDAEMFCITVHTCFVDDGQGQTLTLLDTNGYFSISSSLNSSVGGHYYKWIKVSRVTNAKVTCQPHD